MPTKYDRIQVTKDDELAAALEQAARVIDRPVKAATLVRDLAVRGARSLVEERRRAQAEQERGIEYLIEISTERKGLDWDLLERIDEEAWGIEPRET